MCQADTILLSGPSIKWSQVAHLGQTPPQRGRSTLALQGGWVVLMG